LSEIQQGGGSPLIYLFSNIIQILNGRDSNNQIIYFGPNGTQIHRYILLVFIAKSVMTFSILGKQIDGSPYFTIYSLGRVASYFRSVKPFYSPIDYGRRKVAQKMYEMLAGQGYVEVKKIQGDTYVTTTKKGDDTCNKLLQELVTVAKLSDMAPTIKEADLSYGVYKIKKGIRVDFLRENVNLRMAAEKLKENITKINYEFREAATNIEDEDE
jgi:hypothetical protein